MFTFARLFDFFCCFVCFVTDETIEIKLQLIMLRHRSDPEGSDPSLNVAVVLISPSTKLFGGSRPFLHLVLAEI